MSCDCMGVLLQDLLQEELNLVLAEKVDFVMVRAIVISQALT